ncbi:MAG: NADPH:quinone oxidoreductase family protein [Hyphomicrobiales bacterium]|nr:NADPH:quinone oxidoreductase family protein [Hyphomicrobiales bacterium]
MRAIVCRTWCAPEDLRIEDVPVPAAGEGSVRIKVRAAGVNFADTLIIAGKYQIKPVPPFTPGFEVAGEVTDCGAEVSRFRPGDRVMAIVEYGGFAEQVIAPENQVFALSPGIDDVVAASFPVAYGTSHFGLREKAALQAGETLLVLGAAGGVGLTAVETGKLMGATVIAAASGETKCEIAKQAGADHTIDARAPEFRDRVKDLTDGRGVDVVYDPVGGPAFEQALRCTTPGGRILIVGFASGTVQQIPANILLVKNISAIGFYWGAHRILSPQGMARSFNELIRWLGEGKLRPHVSGTYPLEEAVRALSDLKARTTTGKVVLTLAD